MVNNQTLENYLQKLDKALASINVSDRAEIITEIKSHVLDALEREPEQKIENVLSSLGEPEIVANRYLLERGLKPARPPKHPVVKWLTIGFVATLLFFVFSIGAIVYTFSPLIHVEEDRLILLGGLIDISDDSFKLGSFRINGDDIEFNGSQDFTNGELKALDINFKNGKVDMMTSDSKSFTWECDVDEDAKENEFHFDSKSQAAALDLSHFGGVKCDFYVPQDIQVNIKGKNAKVDIVKPRYDLLIELKNGKIDFERDEAQAYHFDTQVKNGMNDELKSSNSDVAYTISMHLKNGMISED